MPASLIYSLHNTPSFMRSISAAVLIAFSLMILQPTIAVAQEVLSNTQTVTMSNAEGQLSKTLQKIEEKLAKLEEKLQNQQDSTTERSDLHNLQQTLDQQNTEVQQNFAQIEQHILDKQLSPVILERHQTMVTHYQNELAALQTELDGIKNKSDNSTRLNHTQNAKDRLKAKRNKRTQQPFDPNNLSNSSLKAKSENKPKQSIKDFIQAGLYNTPYPQLVVLGDFTFDKLAGANNPAYLAETTEIKITQTIKDKAAELQYDVIKIHNWVRNNIEWQPTWGAIQDSELTLSSKRGNAMDIASLTIALLRASKIPARYVHGSIDVSAERFKNWTGGFDNINAAINFASSGGIPITSIISGGQITKIRLEHIWVEVAVDYFPSRGARNKDADSWIPMDPSYKQYNYQQGLDVIQISGIAPEQVAQSFINSGTENENEGWITGFDASILQNAQAKAQQKLETYIQNNMTDPTVGDVIGGRKTIIQEYPILPSSLPNHIVVSGSRYDKLPSQLQQKITWGFNKDILGDLIDSISFPFAQVNNQKITLSFKPATETDKQALESFLSDGEFIDISQVPTSIPSYLINVVPELKLNGETIKTGTAIKLGEELDFITATNFAGRGQTQSPRTYKVIAGSYLAVNAYAGNISPAKLQAIKVRLENTKDKAESEDSTQIASLTREELMGDLYYAGGLGYYGQYLAIMNLIELQNNGYYQLAAGTGTIGYEPNVDYFFGFPRAIKPGGIAFDIPLVNISEVKDGNLEKKRQFVSRTGVLSSALEHAVPEQMFSSDTDSAEAISAVKAIAKANAQAQKIYSITQANQSTTLNFIRHDSATMTEIRNAINAGKEVITHTDKVSVPGWSGAGYIIVDPQTGNSAYKIAGGANGGFVLSQPSNSAILMIGFTEALKDSPVLVARLAAMAGVSAGLVVLGVLAAIILVVTVIDVVNTMNQLEEEFVEDVKNWAANDAIASQLPDDNCNRNGFSKLAPKGWLKCSYACKAANPPGTTIARYLPVEFNCPTPLPCVPGVGPEIPEKREPYSALPLDVFECKHLVVQ